MVNFLLSITAELENLTKLQPQGGCDDPNLRYHFKLKCGQCGEITQKETYVSLSEAIPLPLGGKGTTNLIQKCKFCDREGRVTMITGRGRPLTNGDGLTETYAPLMAFECKCFEPVDFVFRGEWKAESLEGTKFEGIDLSGDEFSEYCEKGECPVMISNLRSKFTVMK